MKWLHMGFFRLALLALLATAGTSSLARAQWTMANLSCFRESLALGDVPLPNCTETKAETLDDIQYFVSAQCIGCNTEMDVNITPLPFEIGLKNGPCPHPVVISFTGGLIPVGTGSPYIYGTLQGTAANGNFIRIQSSQNCAGGAPLDTGGWGENLVCD